MPSKCLPGSEAVREERLSLGGGLLIAAACLFISLGALASLPRPAMASEPIAIVFPPWTGRASAIAASFEAGHHVLRSGRLASIVVVSPATANERPSLPQGAWFSLTLAGLAGCLDAAGAAGGLS